MDIGVVGINHNLTPIDIREKFNFTETMKIEASSMLLEKNIGEIIILSTCNRSEVYFASNNGKLAEEELISFYREFFKFKDIENYIFKYTNKDCLEHIYMVAGGLDSIVLGEDQILKQIKDALKFSIDLKFSSKVLNRLFMTSLSVGKKIRSNLRISEIPLSTSYIGISILKEELGGFENKSALVIGAGEISQLALKYLDEGMLENIYLTNRSTGNLKEILEKFPKMVTVDYKDRYEILRDCDILVSATAAPHTIINYDLVEPLNKPLYILDLGLPRDVDSKVSELEGVKLYTLDDLNKMSQQNLLKRKELSLRANDLIEPDKNKFINWISKIEVDPYLGSLNDKLEEIRSDSMDFINRKLDLGAREKKMIDKMISYALHRVTRETVHTLKDPENVEDNQYKEIVAEIFSLEV